MLSFPVLPARAKIVRIWQIASLFRK